MSRIESLVISLVISTSAMLAVPSGTAADSPPEAILSPTIVAPSPSTEASVVRLRDSTLKLFSMVKGQHCLSIASHDDGRTWGEPVVEFPVPAGGDLTTRTILDRHGELHVCFLVGRGVGNRRYGIDLFYDIWHAKTADQRATWLPPQRIFAGYVGALRGLIQLQSGRIILPFGEWIGGRPSKPPTGSNEARVLYSDDDGSTWNASPARLTTPVKPVGGGIGAVEPTALELADGRVWMLIRNDSGRLYESVSSDGVTWVEAVPSRFASSESPARLLRLPDGRLMLIWNNCEQLVPPAGKQYSAYSGRDALHAAISEDEGLTWRGFREILRDPKRNKTPPHSGDRGTAYPDAAATADGRILVVSGQGEGRRQVFLFGPKWLYETSQADDFSNGLGGWCDFKAVGPLEFVWRDRKQGPQLTEHPTREGRRALRLCKADGEAGDGAVWNFPLGRSGRLVIRLMLRERFRGAAIALADRFFDPGDEAGERNAMFVLRLNPPKNPPTGSPVELDTGQWYTLAFDWDLEKKRCDVEIDGRHAETLPLNNETVNGVCYLRLRCTAEESDPAGFLVESVAVDVNQPWTRLLPLQATPQHP